MIIFFPNMWLEACNTSHELPDNTFSGLDIRLPDEFKSEVNNETHNELVDCFVESLDISAWSERLDLLLRNVLKILWKDFNFRDSKSDGEWKMNGEFFDRIIDGVIGIIQQKYPKEYEWLRESPSNSQVFINGVHINFYNKLETYAPRKSTRPIKRPDNLISSYFLELEDGGWFQREKNEGLTLAGAYEKYGFPEDLKHWIDLLVSEIYDEQTELNHSQVEQLKKMILFVIKIESYGWYNVVLNDSVRTSWYYQFQVKDGEMWKEIFDFKSKAFRSAGLWKAGDKERKILKWDEKEWVRKVWRMWSYEQALKSLPASVLEYFPALKKQFLLVDNKPPTNWWIVDKTTWLNPELLNSTEQTVLFLSNIYTKDGRQSKELFMEVINGNDNAIIDLYRAIHHADKSNKETEKVVRKIARSLLWINSF